MTHVCTYQEYNVLVRRRQVCLSMLDASDLPIIIILTLRGKIYPAFGPTELDIGMHSLEKHTDNKHGKGMPWSDLSSVSLAPQARLVQLNHGIITGGA